MSDPQDSCDIGGRDPILVVATGGSSGLGYQALIDFVKQSSNNIILVLGCRTPTNPTVSETFKNLPSVIQVDIFPLDLIDLESARTFATHILQSYPQQISVLLLCAAATYNRHLVDQYGNEKTLQTNVLSQARLLQCLWPRLADPEMLKKAPPRIVFVTSSLHKDMAEKYDVSPSTIDDLLATPPWNPKRSYALTKLVQMHLFHITLDGFAKVEGAAALPVAIAVSPGFVPQTGLVREYPWWMRFLMTYIMPLMPFATSLEEGARTIMRAMSDGGRASGDYISPREDATIAAACMDLNLRAAWREWFISKEVWDKDM